MNALILAAGVGSRLGRITSSIPKVLLPVKNQPLLDILIRKLINLKFEKIIINTFYKASMIEEFLRSQDYFEKIVISPEKELLGTGRSLKNNLEILSNDNFLVMHGDNYFEDDLTGLIDFHRDDKTRSLMTMATFTASTPEECGVVEINSDNFIINFHEKIKAPPTNIANAAIYMFKQDSRSLISSLRINENDISKHLIPKFIGISRAFQLNGDLIDIGTPSRYISVK